MRLLVILLTIILLVNILGFVLTNLETRVGVTVWRSEYRDVPLFAVVVLSVLAGIVYSGVIAVTEGANLRLANRRLDREIQKLETELNYLRTQRIGLSRTEPDALQGGVTDEDAQGAVASEPSVSIPSAPVYGNGGGDLDGNSGDDAYSGGRAV